MKGVKTTSDYIPWSDAINVVHKLYRDKNYVMSLFIATGIMTGLRVTDLRSLSQLILILIIIILTL